MSSRSPYSRILQLCVGLLVAAGCNAEKKSDDGDDKTVEGGKEAAAGTEANKRGNGDEDKGSATLELGDDGVKWKAKRAYARIKDDGKLRISASVYNQVDETASRRALTLVISDFKGPGKYEIGDMSSHLTAVKLNLKDVKAAEDEKDAAKADKAMNKAAMDSFGGASVVLLRGAKVEITSVTNDFVNGTLSWSGAIALRGPKKISGEFRARIKKD